MSNDDLAIAAIIVSGVVAILAPVVAVATQTWLAGRTHKQEMEVRDRLRAEDREEARQLRDEERRVEVYVKATEGVRTLMRPMFTERRGGDPVGELPNDAQIAELSRVDAEIRVLGSTAMRESYGDWLSSFETYIAGARVLRDGVDATGKPSLVPITPEHVEQRWESLRASAARLAQLAANEIQGLQGEST
jgi:hypothetical protein